MPKSIQLQYDEIYRREWCEKAGPGFSLGELGDLKSQAAEVKHLEDHSPNPGETAEQVEEVVNRAKADLEVSTSLEQQRQATEAEAEQQLRTEEEKLSRLETQLDELAKNVSNPAGQ